jgi:hypothetical protein
MTKSQVCLMQSKELSYDMIREKKRVVIGENNLLADICQRFAFASLPLDRIQSRLPYFTKPEKMNCKYPSRRESF